MSATVCTCVSCPECGGAGHVWFTFGHDAGSRQSRYLGQHRSDDLDEMETCDTCRGRGITELCDSCVEALYDEEEETI